MTGECVGEAVEWTFRRYGTFICKTISFNIDFLPERHFVVNSRFLIWEA